MGGFCIISSLRRIAPVFPAHVDCVPQENKAAHVSPGAAPFPPGSPHGRPALAMANAGGHLLLSQLAIMARCWGCELCGFSWFCVLHLHGCSCWGNDTGTGSSSPSAHQGSWHRGSKAHGTAERGLALEGRGDMEND